MPFECEFETIQKKDISLRNYEKEKKSLTQNDIGTNELWSLHFHLFTFFHFSKYLKIQLCDSWHWNQKQSLYFSPFLIMSNEPNGNDVTQTCFILWMVINIGQLHFKCSKDFISFWINSHFKLPNFHWIRCFSHQSGEEHKEENVEKVHYQMFCLVIHDIFVEYIFLFVSFTRRLYLVLDSCTAVSNTIRCQERPRFHWIVDIKCDFISLNAIGVNQCLNYNLN